MRLRREPLAITAERPQRVDDDCERADTGAVFLSCEPLSGGGVSTARVQRPKADWAREVVAPLEVPCADYEKISLVPDTLQTHIKGAFY